MPEINPKISREFLNEIKNQKETVIDIEGIKIQTRRNVFPPQSTFSRTSKTLHTAFGDLKDKKVLDMGTGTGVQAIQAVKDGASLVTAVDINPEAVACAKENVKLNGVDNKVVIKEGDLFEPLGKDEKFDVVIANLPITDFPVRGIVESALYDPGYKIHQRFWKEVGSHLNVGGIVIMTHINFKGDADFKEFEKMANDVGFKTENFFEIDEIGYKWRMYRFKK